MIEIKTQGQPGPEGTQGCWIFLDIETTGLDAATGCILEIGLVAVDRQLQDVAHWASPVKPPHGDWLSRLDPYVREMHAGSGLLGELTGERGLLKFEAGGLPTLAEAEAVACQFVKQFGSPPDERGRPRAIMCGANIGSFDRQWLRMHMPALEGMFHYRSVDTNFTFLAEQFLTGGPTLKGETRHRALDDSRQAIASVRGFFGLPSEVK
jgi:oligoribonuclease